jgi:hypothetical protein
VPPVGAILSASAPRFARVSATRVAFRRSLAPFRWESCLDCDGLSQNQTSMAAAVDQRAMTFTIALSA